MSFTIDKKNLPCVQILGTETEQLIFAAKELRRYIEAMLESPLPEKAEKSIFLAVRPEKDIGEEGYIIDITTDEVSITGGGEAGIVYGTYYFLKKCGCRFSAPGPNGEFIPRQDCIEIEEEQITRKPQLWYRGMQAYCRYAPETMLESFDWMAKNGFNYIMYSPLPEGVSETSNAVDPETGSLTRVQRYTNQWFRENFLAEIIKRGLKLDMGHHNLPFWLPSEKYFADHPEWYPLFEGKRRDKFWQLCVCTTNQEAVAEIIKNIKTFIEKNPEVKIVGVIPEDGANSYCQCEKCKEFDGTNDLPRAQHTHRSPDGENKLIIRRYATLLNQIAEALEGDFPEVKIGSAAYVDLQWPPRDVKLHRNVLPWVAIYWRCGAHPLAKDSCYMNSFFFDILEQWQSAHPGKFILYEYYMGMNSQRALPYPMARIICEEWPRLKKLGIGGATLQSFSRNYGVYGLNYLAFAESGWNDKVDYDVLLDDYLLGMFGAAAPAIKPVYEKFDLALEKIRRGEADSKYLKPFPPAIGDLLPNAYNFIYFMEEVGGVEFIMDCISRGYALAHTDREKFQLDIFAKAVSMWEAAREFFVVHYDLVTETVPLTEETGTQHHEKFAKWGKMWNEFPAPGWTNMNLYYQLFEIKINM